MLDAERKASHLIPVCLRVIAKLTEDQCLQLSTPSYRIKKEKRDLKKQVETPQKNSDNSSLFDPSSVMVVGVVDDQGILQSPGSSSGAEKKKKDKKTTSEKPKFSKSSDKPSGRNQTFQIPI